MSINIDIHSAMTANMHQTPLRAPFVSRNMEPIMNDSVIVNFVQK